MPSPDHLAAFALATLILAVVPGPAMLYITAQTLAHGRQTALQAVLGVHLGCYVHIVAASSGLAAVIEYAPLLYDALRVAGIAYLVWLGVALAWRRPTEQDASPGAAAQPSRVLWQSLTVEVLNPKTAVFFIAFLPQFVDAAAALPPWLQFLTLGAITNLAVSTVELAVAWTASNAVGRLTPRPRPWLARRLCGSVLIALGLALAVGFV